MAKKEQFPTEVYMAHSDEKDNPFMYAEEDWEVPMVHRKNPMVAKYKLVAVKSKKDWSK